jgi:uncharacterized protein YyaL (SSP411 family)
MTRRLTIIALIVAMAAAAPAGEPAARVAWHDLDAALSASAEAGKPVMIHFTADWCGWCKKMQREVYAQTDVAALINERFLPAMVDTDRRPDLKARYGVRGLPTIWFLTSTGEGITYVPGYVDAPTFRQLLEWVSSDAYREQSFDEFTGAGG